MIRHISLTMIVGIVLAITFISIASWLLFFADSISVASRDDLRLYALLTGAYGIWRLVRVWLAWKEAKKNV